MNYAGIKYCDIANGLGCRTVLFVSGCRNHCKGCFQPQTWEFDYGEPFDEQIQNEILDSLKPAYVQGITLLGGDPFEEENQEALVPFIPIRMCGLTQDICTRSCLQTDASTQSIRMSFYP